ncbi:MAG TPA: aldehyde dehydrogenase family protein [Ilumatobacteraceae bacterium]
MTMTDIPEVALPSGAMLIGDAWVSGASDTTREHLNPATGRPLGSFTMGTPADIDAAVDAATAAFPAWAAMAPPVRRDILLNLARLLSEHDVELGTMRTLELGAPLKRKRGRSMAAEYVSYYAGWVDKIEGSTVPLGPNAVDYTRPEPYGVVAVIIPWNGPVVSAAMKVAPALAAGNCVVLKPSELGPISALRFGELCLEAGIPPGVVNIVPGGADAGDRLVRHPGVAKISFTGGGATAQRIMVAAAERLKPLTLELGGKSALLIFADGNVDKAVQIGVTTGLVNLSGQGCVLPTRMLVQDSIFDEVESRVAGIVGALKPGDPFDPTTTFGPVINEAAADRILGVIGKARADSAGRLLAGGSRMGGALAAGFYVEPTVFSDVDNASSLAQEEVFGPVLSLVRFSDEADGIAKANDTKFGLGGFVFTRDISRGHRVAAGLEAGSIGINGFPPMPPGAPFGGVKQSGYGREGGPAGLWEFLQLKNVYVELDAG